MSPHVTVMTPAGWVCFLMAAVSAAREISVYKKVGDTVVLNPDAGSSLITSIMWKDGPNIAAQWDGTDLDLYRQFKERGSLNISSGELTIRGLARGDSGLYTPEINNNLASPTRLTVISPVPTPTVGKSCDEEETVCTLSCDGNTTAAEPVTYRWTSGGVVLPGLLREQRITKEVSSSMAGFVCELENPVSKESSEPLPNPFYKIPVPIEPTVEGHNLKISTGVTVFICLLTAVVMLVLFHRCKAGMWFYQKASMPWEADFWRKHERPWLDTTPPSACESCPDLALQAESNGTTAREEPALTQEKYL
ncbi:uncharacterized protein [Pempheris klunzingeri]|uniref:uncharacterized protein n=1 Tax=Pempheris klunzingeri TaxID=3127111 RepID=UPI00397F3C3C